MLAAEDFTSFLHWKCIPSPFTKALHSEWESLCKTRSMNYFKWLSPLCLAPLLWNCGVSSPRSVPVDSGALHQKSEDQNTQTKAEAITEQLRGMGPEGLLKALATYDALPPGAAKEAQALQVDAVAGQRYATHSRLYWYTDLEEAKRAAQESGRAILSLRLLGALDEDYSCANSRMFRTVLYANTKVSKFLRSNVVLHWSSEREVPKVTIDFGGGRVMKSTIAGNSAHYVTLASGQPIDILPGLYSPNEFIHALERSLSLVKKLKEKSESEQEATIRSFHQRELQREGEIYRAMSSARKAAIAPYRTQQNSENLLAAEMLTFAKSAIEAPLAAEIAPDPSVKPPKLLDVLGAMETEALDASSTALIQAIGPTDWGVAPTRLQGKAFADLLDSLRKKIAGDTMINKHGLHPLIHEEFARSPLQEFSTLNAWLYSTVFVTPANDPWLGIAQPKGFSGLPGDGLQVK